MLLNIPHPGPHNARRPTARKNSSARRKMLGKRTRDLLLTAPKSPYKSAPKRLAPKVPHPVVAGKNG